MLLLSLLCGPFSYAMLLQALFFAALDDCMLAHYLCMACGHFFFFLKGRVGMLVCCAAVTAGMSNAERTMTDRLLQVGVYKKRPFQVSLDSWNSWNSQTLFQANIFLIYKHFFKRTFFEFVEFLKITNF